MKTLNKTLSLVLALVMVFSLFGVASAAKLGDFTDKDDITETYVEAVDYLTAAGVVAGDTATTINPKGNFTREQAAKLIAYAMLGQAAADAMKAPAAPFSDVAADRWSAGYIAYCVSEGVINGMGDGTFAPTAEVTGYQMAKMLLCGLGYGVNDEFVGASWQLEVAKLALAKDIFYGNTAGANNTTGATREEAFLYTFNALTRAMLVKYNSSLAVYYSGTNPFEMNQEFDVKNTIGLQRFKMEAKPDTGSYDEPARYWAIDGKKVTGTYSIDPIVLLASSTSGTPYANLTTKGDTAYIGYAKDTTDSKGNTTEVAYYINGDKQTGVEAITKQTNMYFTAGVAADLCDFKGNVVNFYDTDKDGKYDTVEVLVYNVAKLEAAPVVAGTEGNQVVTIADIGMSKIPTSDITGEYKDLAKGDYVLYYSNAKKTSWTVAKCETVTGQMFGFNETAGQFNINGTQYGYSQIFRADSGMDFDDIKETSGLANTVFYLDAGKNIVGAEPVEAVVAAANVVFVLDAKGGLGGSVQAQLLKSDGSTVIKTINKVTSVGNTTSAAKTTDGTTGNVLSGKFYTFTENKDNSYLLKEISGTANVNSKAVAHQISKTGYGGTTSAPAAVFTKGQASFAAGIATTGTNKTVFVLEGNGTSVDTYKAYTGVSNIPSVVNTDAAGIAAKAYVLNDKDGYAIMAVALDGKLDTSVLTMDYAFIGFKKSDVTMTDNNGDKYYNFPIATLNGEVKAAGIDATETGAGLYTGLVAIDKYNDGKVDGAYINETTFAAAANLAGGDSAQVMVGKVMAAQTAQFAGTRLARVIFGVNEPADWAGAVKINNAMNSTTTGFKVEGDTVKYASAAGTAEAFVVSSDVKVYYHDLREANTTGKITIEKQSGIGALANLPVSNSTTTYTYGVSALRVSDKDSTINELYITRYPAIDRDDDGGDDGGDIETYGKVTYINASGTKADIGGKNVTLVDDAVTLFSNYASDLKGTDVSVVTNSAGEVYAIDGITLKADKAYTNAFIDAIVDINGITIVGDAKVETDKSLAGPVTVAGDNVTLKYFTIDGNLIVADNNFKSVQNHITGNVTVTGKNATFNTKIDGNVIVNGEGASFSNVKIGGNLSVAASAKKVTISGSTKVTGTISVTTGATIDASKATDEKVKEAAGIADDGKVAADLQKAKDAAGVELAKVSAAKTGYETKSGESIPAELAKVTVYKAVTDADTALTTAKSGTDIADIEAKTTALENAIIALSEETTRLTNALQAIKDASTNQVNLLAALKSNYFKNVVDANIVEYAAEAGITNAVSVKTVNAAIVEVNEQVILDAVIADFVKAHSGTTLAASTVISVWDQNDAAYTFTTAEIVDADIIVTLPTNGAGYTVEWSEKTDVDDIGTLAGNTVTIVKTAENSKTAVYDFTVTYGTKTVEGSVTITAKTAE